jgi:hypothetical protein
VANNNGSTVSGHTINPTTGALKHISGSPFAAGRHPVSVAVARGPKHFITPNPSR